MKALEQAVAALRGGEAIAMASHINPDGDSLGSLLGLAMALSRAGKKVYPGLPEPWKYPPQYLFLPGRELLLDPSQLEEAPELFIALDCSNAERLGELREKAQAASLLINIDHHEDNSLFGGINVVDKEASSTSEIVYRALKAAGWSPPTPAEATCLYTGLVADTGRFRHHNTSASAFAVAGELVQAGADIFRVGDELYGSQSLAYTRLLGRVLQRAEIVERHAFAYSYITRRDLAETGATLPETEDMIDHLRALRQTRVVALFKELPDGKVRVSLRSRDGFEVGPIARLLGGGGHALAAGYTSASGIEASLGGLLEMLERGRA